MNIREIYNKFLIPQNLQQHMLRVGAFSSILVENWTGAKIDKKAIVKACLVHDIAKPIDFDLKKQAQFGMSEKDIEMLRKLQLHIKAKYGQDEYSALIAIAKEIGCDAVSLRVLEKIDWKNIPNVIKYNDLESMIAIYSDMRIGVSGILTLSGRLNELKLRAPNQDFTAHKKNGEKLEYLFGINTTLDLNSVSDEMLNSKFIELLDLNIE